MDQQLPTQSEPLGVSVAEALRMIGGKIGRSTLYDAIKRGELVSVRFGSRIIIPLAALRRQFGVGQ
jgi:hypothetical protein